MDNAFFNYLNKFDETSWNAAIEKLLPSIHAVDRHAVQIWFRFYPLGLFRALEAAEDREALMRKMNIQGDYGLTGRIDTSHEFFYGHRYWKAVKAAIEAEAVVFENTAVDLADEIGQIAAMVAEKVKADTSLLIGITAAGMMTLVQTGFEAFKAAAGEPRKPSGVMAQGPDAIVESRERDDSQGLLGFLKTVDKKYSIIYNEYDKNGRFAITNEQQVTSASAADRSKDWQKMDERCWEGPIPVECTAASCGTCWIGVLGGEDKLTEVAAREKRRMKVFGYGQPDEPKPFLRLACQTYAVGNATIVIPPWNGVFGKRVYGNVEELELEPVTTSAQRLRETVSSALSNDGE